MARTRTTALKSTALSVLAVAAALAGSTGCDQIAPPGMTGSDGKPTAKTPPTRDPTPTPAPPTTNPHTGVAGGPGGTGQAAAPAPPDDPTVFESLGLRGPKPARWVWHPPLNPMRVANFAVPGNEEGGAGELIVFFFGTGQGGPIQGNIDRWVGQFQAPGGGEVTPLVEEVQVDGMPVTLVELAGEYKQMSQQWFTPDQLFIVAIVDAPAGRIFIRITGPTATVEANREAFMELIHGLRKS